MADVLMISKPVAPPWNDSSKNLVWELACKLRAHRASIMSFKEHGLELSNGTVELVYGNEISHYALRRQDQLAVLRRLAWGPRRDVWHFFFAPNPKTSTVSRWIAKLRRVPTVQTVCSAPKPRKNLDSLFFADKTVVLSKHTENLLLEAGVRSDRIARIAPAISAMEPLNAEQRDAARDELGLPDSTFIFLYPGDLEFGRGAETVIDAFAQLRYRDDALLVMACRPKTAEAHVRAHALQARCAELGISPQVRWLGEVSQIHRLLGCVDFVLLPTDTLYAKMDYPLVILEAMMLERPVLVSRGTAAEELAAENSACVVSLHAEEIAAALTSLMEHRDARERFAHNGRAHVLSHFSPPQMAAQYEKLYDTLL